MKCVFNSTERRENYKIHWTAHKPYGKSLIITSKTWLSCIEKIVLIPYRQRMSINVIISLQFVEKFENVGCLRHALSMKKRKAYDGVGLL